MKNLIVKIKSTDGKYEAIFGVLSLVYVVYGLLNQSLPVPLYRSGDSVTIHIVGLNLAFAITGLLIYAVFLIVPFAKNWVKKPYSPIKNYSGVIVGMLIFGLSVNASS